MKTFGMAALSAALIASSVSSAAAAERIELAPCNFPGLSRPARCGELEVLENPDRPQGRRLKIAVAVIPASEGPATSDPIVPLMGGPGEQVIALAVELAQVFAGPNRQRDLLLVDQRGTGRSGGFDCRFYSEADPATSLRDLFPVPAVERCARELGGRADLTQYGYLRFADDLEAVRRSLGYSALNLSAGSYGTRAAQVIMRAYPKSVRTAYLGSVIPIDLATPLLFSHAGEQAMDKTLVACASDAKCSVAFPNLREEFRQVMIRLNAGNVRVDVPGTAHKAALDRGRVAEWFRSMLYRPARAAELPLLIHRAYQGDYSPIARGILDNARGADVALSFALFLTITCSEDVAFIEERDVDPATKGTFLGDYRLRQQQAACAKWPRYSLPADYREPVQSAVPTMFVSGDADGGTPIWLTAHAAPGFSNRVEIVQRNQGHTEWNDCVARLYERFVATGSVEGIDPSSCPEMPRLPFRTELH
jgi:pimeloyl-ACP methyl ester carboxylesterase